MALAAKCGGDTLKPQRKIAEWDTPRTRAHNHATHTLSPDMQRNERRIRHIAPRCRACCDLQRNQTLVLRNSSPLHTEKHDGKPHRGTKTMSAQVGESHASTVKRLSKSPAVATCQLHNARRNTPRNNRIRRGAACGPTRPQHTSQKNMFSRAANFNYHDMLRTSLSSDTHTPLVSNTADHACPMPPAPPLARRRGNTSSAANEIASDGESKMESQLL